MKEVSQASEAALHVKRLLSSLSQRRELRGLCDPDEEEEEAIFRFVERHFGQVPPEATQGSTIRRQKLLVP